jgi:hypothetical protein
MKPSSATLLFSSFAISSAAYAGLYAGSAGFRSLVWKMDVRKLTLVQTARLVGAVMFTQQTLRGRITGRFGFTTALSDLIAGATAPLAAALLPDDRLRVWHWAGFLGLIVSGGSGILTSPTRLGVLARWKTSRRTDSLPLVLVPLAFGPAVLIAHYMALTQLSGLSGTDR